MLYSFYHPFKSGTALAVLGAHQLNSVVRVGLHDLSKELPSPLPTFDTFIFILLRRLSGQTRKLFTIVDILARCVSLSVCSDSELIIYIFLLLQTPCIQSYVLCQIQAPFSSSEKYFTGINSS